jgi:hypothetical protein
MRRLKARQGKINKLNIREWKMVILIKSKTLTSLVSSLFILLLILFSSYSASSTEMAPGVPQAPTDQPGKTETASNDSIYKIIPITMEMEAGAAQYKQWPGGQKTIHAGIGWIEPFGRSEYVAGRGYPEQARFPKPSWFNEEFNGLYDSSPGLFCIYMLKDGNIYAYDGVVGTLDPASDDDGKMDYLINVIVGGTGAYEGATGMLLGKTPGRGKSTEVGDGVKLPVSILKIMSGYIRIPVKK